MSTNISPRANVIRAGRARERTHVPIAVSGRPRSRTGTSYCSRSWLKAPIDILSGWPLFPRSKEEKTKRKGGRVRVNSFFHRSFQESREGEASWETALSGLAASPFLLLSSWPKPRASERNIFLISLTKEPVLCVKVQGLHLCSLHPH